MLPGDIIARLAERETASQPLPERDRGLLDPQSFAEFLALDIPFDVEPALGFTFPAEVDDG